jgi:hypothetical protein
MSPAMASADVVSTLDMSIKGFKGKGAAWANETRARLVGIRNDMQALARQTRAVRGHDYLLTVHVRKHNGQHALRWRLAGRPARHVSWTAIAGQVDVLPPALAAWYRQAHSAALCLNHQEMAARHELRLAERYREEVFAVRTPPPRTS